MSSIAGSARSHALRSVAQPSALRTFARHLLLPLAGRTRWPHRRAVQPLRNGHAGEASQPLAGRRFVSARDADVATLVYELLDAHADTAELVDAHGCDEQWQAHIDYLRALQRKGRETLARLGAM